MNGPKLIPPDLISRNGIPLLVVIIVVLLEIAGDEASSLLRYDREAILDGQIWRLLSGHFIHNGWSHLGMNLAWLALIWELTKRWLTSKEILITITLSALTIGLGLLALNPEVSWYVGFSGILHGIWAVGAISGMRTRHWEAYVLFISLVAKLAWKQLIGPLPGSVELSGVPVIGDAHLYGAIFGLTYALLLHLIFRKSSPQQYPK